MLHQLARFSAIAPLVEEAGPGELLDVGSGSEGVAGWIGPQWRVTAVDESFDYIGAMSGPAGAPRRAVVADARALPFPDRSFDVVLALDVLEHIPPGDRPRTLAELVRTARRRVIVAGPAGAEAHAADMRLAGRLRARGMTPPGWLLEHEANGLPEREELVEALGGARRVRVLGDSNLRWHEWLYRLESRRPGFHLSRAAALAVVRGLASRGPAQIAARLALRLVKGPARGPFYRTIAVVDIEG